MITVTDYTTVPQTTFPWVSAVLTHVGTGLHTFLIPIRPRLSSGSPGPHLPATPCTTVHSFHACLVAWMHLFLPHSYCCARLLTVLSCSTLHTTVTGYTTPFPHLDSHSRFHTPFLDHLPLPPALLPRSFGYLVGSTFPRLPPPDIQIHYVLLGYHCTMVHLCTVPIPFRSRSYNHCTHGRLATHTPLQFYSCWFWTTPPGTALQDSPTCRFTCHTDMDTDAPAFLPATRHHRVRTTRAFPTVAITF